MPSPLGVIMRTGRRRTVRSYARNYVKTIETFEFAQTILCLKKQLFEFVVMTIIYYLSVVFLFVAFSHETSQKIPFWNLVTNWNLKISWELPVR